MRPNYMELSASGDAGFPVAYVRFENGSGRSGYASLRAILGWMQSNGVECRRLNIRAKNGKLVTAIRGKMRRAA